MDECTCRNKGTQLASPSTRFWTPGVCFLSPESASRQIVSPGPSPISPASRGSWELWIPWYYSPIGSPRPARGPGFPALLRSLTLDLQGFFLAFPGPLPHSSVTLTLADPSPRPSVNTYFSLQAGHFPAFISFKRSSTTPFLYRATLPQLLEPILGVSPSLTTLLKPSSRLSVFGVQLRNTGSSLWAQYEEVFYKLTFQTLSLLHPHLCIKPSRAPQSAPSFTSLNLFSTLSSSISGL